MKPLTAMLLGVGLVAAGAAWADTFIYAGDTTGGPRWNRPIENLSMLSSVGTGVPYHALDFWVDLSGPYDLENTCGDHPDPMLFLYHVRLDTAFPLTNAVAGDDDSGASYCPAIFNVPLTAGEQYTLVTTGFQNRDAGSFTNEIDGPGVVRAETLPEPGTLLLVVVGVALLALRRALRATGAPPR